MVWSKILRFKECGSHETNIKYEVVKLMLFKLILKEFTTQLNKIFVEFEIFKDEVCSLCIEDIKHKRQIVIKILNTRDKVKQEEIKKLYDLENKNRLSLFEDIELHFVYIKELPTDIDELEKVIESIAIELKNSSLK